MTESKRNTERLLTELSELRRQIRECKAEETRHQRQVEAWRDLWAQYEAMIEAFDGLIYICSQNYEIEFMNQAFIKRTGYYPLGQKCYTALHDRKDICPWCVNKQVFQGETVRWEILSPKDHHWYYVVNTPINHPDGSISKMALIQDITERKHTEEALKESEESYRTLVNNVNVGVYRNLGSPEGRFIKVNPAMVRMFGYDSVDEFLQINVTDLYQDPKERRLFVRELARTGQVKNKELRLRKKDGAPLWASVSATALYDPNDQIKWIDGVIEDITERKQAEESLHRATRALKTLSACQAALVRAVKESAFLKAICRTSVESGGYRLAWVGLARQDETRTVIPVAQAGYEKGYLKTVSITWADTERGRGPVGTAIRTGKTSIINNILNDPRFAPWREEARQRRYASVIALPLMADGQAFGALAIYAKEPDAFDAEEVKLLEELADAVAFGILTLRARAAKPQDASPPKAN
jgi:PAS domain S-box-containing protein